MARGRVRTVILWRHAEAEDGYPDMERALTPKGESQARKTGDWLRKKMPEGALILCSPAKRAIQTATACQKDFQVRQEIQPGQRVADIMTMLKELDSPALILVGHQPTLGQLASYLVTGEQAPWAVKKSALWWLEGTNTTLMNIVTVVNG